MFSVSKSTLSQLGYQSNKSYQEIDAKTLVQTEQKTLFNEAFKYLSKAERSPLAFSKWLSNRLVPADWQQTLTQMMIDKRFLCEIRFAEVYVSKWQKRGGKPRWMIVKELEAFNVSKKVANEINYTDEESLKNYIKRNLAKFHKSPKGFIDKLHRRGFSADIVNLAIKDL